MLHWLVQDSRVYQTRCTAIYSLRLRLTMKYLQRSVAVCAAIFCTLYYLQSSLSYVELSRELSSAKMTIQQLEESLEEVNAIRIAKQPQQSDINHIESEILALKQKELPETGSGPSEDHEDVRRRLSSNIGELWNYLQDQLPRINQTANIVKHVREQHRTIGADLKRLEGDFERWRKQQHFELQDLMQRRLHYLQNPDNCTEAKKLLCRINQDCGFGCQLHHITYCFMIAYGLQRVFIIESKTWNYGPRGWESLFLPISSTCSSIPEGQTAVQWRSEESNANDQVIQLPRQEILWDEIKQPPHYGPLSVPEDLYPRLRRIHGDPAVWFIGQFLSYLLKPQAHLEKIFEDYKRNIGFKNPIVGLQIRRTDKITYQEAQYHSLDQYMQHVEEWFAKHELLVNQTSYPRLIYLATDDPSVLPEARQRYPRYMFISNTSVSESAGLSSRYTESSLLGVILDIHLLSQCDFLVCTFSSNICRLPYAIMQSLRPDASRDFYSLDDIYWFAGQWEHKFIVTYPHEKTSEDEIDLKPGDYIHIAGNHWNGYSKGRNLRTGQVGLFPSYKIKDVPFIVKYPTYPQVPDSVS